MIEADNFFISIKQKLIATEDEIAFAEERLALHNATKEGHTIEDFKNYMYKKHGFEA